MTWALLASALCGVTGFLEPLDDAARNLRYALRFVPADGSVVVVSIDQKSVDQLGGKFPWPRTYEAKLIDNLKKAGVRKIVFDRAFSDVDTPENDAVLTKMLDRYRGDVFFGSAIVRKAGGDFDGPVIAAKVYRPHVEIATFMSFVNPLGQVAKLYTQSPRGSAYPALSVILADSAPLPYLTYRPDFAIRASTVPRFHFADIVANKVARGRLAGKNAIVGYGEAVFGDRHSLPGQGRAQGLYAHVIGAQTLRSGSPVDLGWLPALVLTAIASIGILQTNRIIRAVGIAAGMAAGVAVLPLILDGKLISVDVAPALLMLGMTFIQHARLSLGWRKSRTHESSGLPNVVALREVQTDRSRVLIAARIDNHAAITASFDMDVEVLMAAEIVSRLKIGDAETPVFQGDEGVYYLLSPIRARPQLCEHLDGLHALFSQPIRVGERKVDVTVTFGVDDSTDSIMSSRIGSALLSAEDARRQGLRWKIYDGVRNADAAWQLSLGSEIDRGLESGEFWVAYQPKLDLQSGIIVGAEALVRWAHPQRGAIGPIDFIPTAERDHRIVGLTHFVFRQVIADAIALDRLANMVFAINVSVVVLRQPDFATFAIDLVAQSGLSSSKFTVEITESIFLTVDDVILNANLARLAAAGFGISIDDFGTGFSTLESLQKVPATEVKIDQTFVKALTTQSADRVIVASIIRMAQGLNHKVVAEGVEDEETMRQLSALGCNEVQGYFIGRPQRLDEFARLVSPAGVRTAA